MLPSRKSRRISHRPPGVGLSLFATSSRFPELLPRPFQPQSLSIPHERPGSVWARASNMLPGVFPVTSMGMEVPGGGPK